MIDEEFKKKWEPILNELIYDFSDKQFETFMAAMRENIQQCMSEKAKCFNEYILSEIIKARKDVAV